MGVHRSGVVVIIVVDDIDDENNILDGVVVIAADARQYCFVKRNRLEEQSIFCIFVIVFLVVFCGF